MSRAVARAPQPKLLPCPGRGRKVQCLSRGAPGKRGVWGAQQNTTLCDVTPPGGPCGHHSGGQPAAVHVCQGDRRLRDAQGQGVYVPLPPPPWAHSGPHCPVHIWGWGSLGAGHWTSTGFGTPRGRPGVGPVFPPLLAGPGLGAVPGGAPHPSGSIVTGIDGRWGRAPRGTLLRLWGGGEGDFVFSKNKFQSCCVWVAVLAGRSGAGPGPPRPAAAAG